MSDSTSILESACDVVQEQKAQGVSAFDYLTSAGLSEDEASLFLLSGDVSSFIAGQEAAKRQTALGDSVHPFPVVETAGEPVSV